VTRAQPRMVYSVRRDHYFLKLRGWDMHERRGVVRVSRQGKVESKLLVIDNGKP
jgi:hypothetical protein